ncbi:MAG: hypothetical protein KBB70_00360 [Candidatus Pacebacteria bacterium]|nr:hypothetical protein [Candidatus Paceibacterota bacterium]
MKQIKTIFNQLKSVRMSAEEKSQMRITLVSLSENPNLAPASKPTVEQYRTKRSPLSTWSFANSFRTAGAGVFILLLASTGVSYAAEKTLPGDFLFPVKVNVNEEVRGALTVSHEDKMNWEKERVVRRVVETETLLKTNKFTLKRKTDAEAALKTQMATFATAAAETSVKNPNAVIAATAELEPELKVHQEVIANIAASSTFAATTEETATILDTVALGITAASQQETVAIDVAVDKNPDTLAALTDEKISGAMLAIDTSEPEKAEQQEAQEAKESADASTISTMSTETDAASTTDTKPVDSEQTKETGETTSDTKNETPKDPTLTAENPIGDTKADTKTDSKAELKMAPSTLSTTVMTAAAPEPLDPKEVLAAAKIKLQQAKVLREKGDFKAALVLAQDAYKDMVALRIQSKLAKKAAKEGITSDTPVIEKKIESEATPAPETKKEDPTTTNVETKVDNTPTIKR